MPNKARWQPHNPNAVTNSQLAPSVSHTGIIADRRAGKTTTEAKREADFCPKVVVNFEGLPRKSRRNSKNYENHHDTNDQMDDSGNKNMRADEKANRQPQKAHRNRIVCDGAK